MVEQPKMYYWAETGPDAGKCSAAIYYDTRRGPGGIYFSGNVTANGMEAFVPFAKVMFNALKANGLEPELVNSSPPTKTGRKFTPNEEQQVLQALKGK